mmetsp:Transcript_29352/g.71541  ORF Transcript_29352/g.71541 Transcript_29352/m.71541 type:complete len:116 (-) Transcript_29352:229-576(-)
MDGVKMMIMHIGKEITFGGLMGACAGYATKQVAKQVAYAIGLFFIGVQVLAYNDVIKIPYSDLSKKFQKTLDLNDDDKLDADDLIIVWNKVKKVLAHGLPNAAGFAAGFALGLRF